MRVLRLAGALGVNGIAPTFDVRETDAGCTLEVRGDWLTARLGRVPQHLSAALRRNSGRVEIDASELGRIDTGGAYAFIRAFEDEHQVTVVEGGDREDIRRLLQLVEPARRQVVKPLPRSGGLNQTFERIGRAVVHLRDEAYREQVFLGRLLHALAGTLVKPSRLRWTPFMVSLEQAGLAGIPIVVIMTFFIGAVLALVGSTMLQTLGVTIYAVELVGIGVLREFGAVIAAILFAGRSASAFAAQIGSMRMNQEVDAMTVMGVDPFQALVVPRVLAALVMLPLLTIAADMGGIVGGLLVSYTLLDIEPQLFLQRLVDSVGAQQFWIGLAKAPFFALVIATTGCRQGLAVGGDVESLGARVTSAVVQSIFLIIMFDALFAVLFRELHL